MQAPSSWMLSEGANIDFSWSAIISAFNLVVQISLIVTVGSGTYELGRSSISLVIRFLIRDNHADAACAVISLVGYALVPYQVRQVQHPVAIVHDLDAFVWRSYLLHLSLQHTATKIAVSGLVLIMAVSHPIHYSGIGYGIACLSIINSIPNRCGISKAKGRHIRRPLYLRPSSAPQRNEEHTQSKPERPLLFELGRGRQKNVEVRFWLAEMSQMSRFLSS
jgi:hypothetical protein